MNRQLIVDILRDACRAPSGDNAQPWRFSVSGETIRVINIPERDTSLFNWQQRTNHVAIGAAIENLRISAEAKGFRTVTRLFPEPGNPLVVAAVEFFPDAPVHMDLAAAIGRRATNRKKYLPRSIDPEILAQLATLATSEGYRISFISDPDHIHQLAHTLAAGERLAIENRSVHDFLFGHVTWTRAEDDINHGFFIDTFEFNPVQKMAFRVLKSWQRVKILLPLGIARVVAGDAEKIHATSAAFGALILPGRSSVHFVTAGMLIERLWLAATQRGIALQPTTTVHYIGARVLEGGTEQISEDHQRMLREGYAALAQSFDVAPSEEFGFIFRLGFAPPPSAVTTRHEPDVTYEDDESTSG